MPLAAALVALAVSACAAASPPSGSGGPSTDLPAPVAAIGGRRVTKAELCDAIYARRREVYAEALDDLVDERLAAEAKQRFPVTVPSAVLSAAVDAEVQARTEQLRARFGDPVDLEASVRAWYGTGVLEWRRDVLAPRLRAVLETQRVVRLLARTREQVSARVIVVRDAERARALREKLDRGADFSLLALDASEDPTKAKGGALAPIARGDLAVPTLENALFAAREGSVVGPLEVRTPLGPEWHLYRVVARIQPWVGDPASLAARLEDDLVKNPLLPEEYDRWATRARREAGVVYFAPDGSVLRPTGVRR